MNSVCIGRGSGGFRSAIDKRSVCVRYVFGDHFCKHSEYVRYAFCKDAYITW